MDFISLLTGSENLYKYCFVGGLALIVLCLFYPLNKRYELANRRDLHSKEIMLINLDIEDLNKDYAKIKEEVASYSKGSSKAKDSINKHFALLLVKRKQIAIKEAEIKYDSLRIATLKENIHDITSYENSFKWAGWIFTIIGFIGWFILMIKKHKENTTT